MAMRNENKTENMTPNPAEIIKRVTRFEALLERLNAALSETSLSMEALTSAQDAAMRRDCCRRI